MADSKWFQAVVTADIRVDDKCPLCIGKSVPCTECNEGRAVYHMWGYVKGDVFFKKGDKVMVARRDAFTSEHFWNERQVNMTYRHPEEYFVFSSGGHDKLRVTTAYAKTHLKRIVPHRECTQLGELSLEDYYYEMSR
jgi:hypothetical protein